MKCSYGKISSPLTEISVGKTEISGTEPARPLIWTHRKFYKGFRGKARSRNPGQPGQPGSYEEALIGVVTNAAGVHVYIGQEQCVNHIIIIIAYRWVIPPPLNTAFAFFSFFFCFSSRNALILTFSSEFFISSYPQGFIWNEDEIVASMRMLLWLTPMLFFFFLVLLISSKLYWIEF